MCLTFVFGALLEFALVNYASRRNAIKDQQKKIVHQATHATRRVCDMETMPPPNSNFDSSDINSSMINTTGIPGVNTNIGYNLGPNLGMQQMINDTNNINVSFSKVMKNVFFSFLYNTFFFEFLNNPL